MRRFRKDKREPTRCWLIRVMALLLLASGIGETWPSFRASGALLSSFYAPSLYSSGTLWTDSRNQHNGHTAELQKQSAATFNSTDPGKLPIKTFERLRKLEGKWLGRSTKGWQETVTYKVIARGSVVYESSFDAKPNAAMATMFYLDGSRLLLTHYCVSQTQPRLQATSFEDGGRKVTFTFLDATNLPSRDKGHMDKVIINFIDDDHFASKWTWYQNAKETWLEEIKYERIK